MKRWNEHTIDAMLSLYLDGDLPPDDVRELESLLAADADVRRKFGELKRLKELLSARNALTPDIGFWTRLAVAREEADRSRSAGRSSRRMFLPVITAVAAVVAVTTIAVKNRSTLSAFFRENTAAVRDAYTKNILQGGVLPLFSKVDRDQAFQFSMFGTLPLDAKTGTSLKVDEQSEKGYRIEVGKALKHGQNTATFDKFLAEVKPSDEQKQVIDSLLAMTGKRIESSVLIGENNTMAIAPDLPKMNRIVVKNIAACLHPTQRVRFERFLAVNDAPYTISDDNAPVANPEHILAGMHRMPRVNQYLVLTPDSGACAQVQIDFDSLQRQMMDDLRSMQARREELLQKMLARDTRGDQGMVPAPPPEIFNVEINAPQDESEPQQVHIIIQRRLRPAPAVPPVPGHPMVLQTDVDTAARSTAPR